MVREQAVHTRGGWGTTQPLDRRVPVPAHARLAQVLARWPCGSLFNGIQILRWVSQACRCGCSASRVSKEGPVSMSVKATVGSRKVKNAG